MAAPAPGQPAIPEVAAARLARDGSVWTVNPYVSGEDLPAAGRSLFDFVATEARGDVREYVLPFPFTALVARIQERAGRDASSPLPGVKQVLIPLGRSLQRTAAAPEFFRYPRVVVAVDEEPRGSATRPAILLKDRLYLGYQEKANVIEVISYNEAAGRFEFQLVKDYGPRLKPRVLYAKRNVCMSCHQNGAPIFSRQVWDETNANPKVAALLREQKRDFYGIDLNRGVDIPNAIDSAVKRANMLAVYQLLWREGCGANDVAATRCRVELFKAALRYKLSGQELEDDSPAVQSQPQRHLIEHAMRQWPHGLAIGNPEIPNRNPMSAGAEGAMRHDLATPNPIASKVDADSLRRLANLSNVASPFEPLNPRPPLEVWRMERPADVRRLIRGLAEFLPRSDTVQLDAYLTRVAARRPTPRVAYRAVCSMSHGSSAGSERLDFSCTPTPERIAGGLNIEGRIELRSQKIDRLILDRLQVAGNGNARDVDPVHPVFEKRQRGQQVTMQLSRAGLQLRGADGNAVERLQITWSGATGTASAIVAQDFGVVEKAVEAMLRANLDGSVDSFSALPFRSALLMPALFTRLGMGISNSCCLASSGLPPAATERPAVGAASVTNPASQRPNLELFYRYCATCHLTADRFPPNFLAGTVDEVEGKLAQCAERIYVRLAMWRQEESARAKTPMPPLNALTGFGIDEASWRNTAALAQLNAYVDEALKKQSTNPAGVRTMLAQGYENLRPCLPDSGAGPKASAANH